MKEGQKESVKILVVDDSKDTLEMIQRNLKNRGYTVYTAESVQNAVKVLEHVPIDIVISDLKMPKAGGRELIHHVRENYRNTEIMIISGYATVENAVEMMKVGALDFLSKPFTDEELFQAVQNLLEKISLRREATIEESIDKNGYAGIIGNSKPMQKVYQAVEKSAKTDATVLITGESGTGKELVARAIHYHSPRVSAPFVPVNCGSIPETLLESELFGFVKGAFTGAIESRAGFFQTADKGTIFLDEVGDTTLAMQAKLLRVLQEKEVFMIGSTKPRTVDVRVLAATNKNLFDMIQKGTFREDLFYRLNVITISMPPLRDRGGDINMLINYFTRLYAEEAGKPVPRYSDKSLAALSSYHWPGNVRELQNVIRRLVIMHEGGQIEAPDLPELMRFSALKRSDVNKSLGEIEREHIAEVIQHTEGNKSQAARILGIDRKTLRKKIKDYGIPE